MVHQLYRDENKEVMDCLMCFHGSRVDLQCFRCTESLALPSLPAQKESSGHRRGKHGGGGVESGFFGSYQRGQMMSPGSVGDLLPFEWTLSIGEKRKVGSRSISTCPLPVGGS